MSGALLEATLAGAHHLWITDQMLARARAYRPPGLGGLPHAEKWKLGAG